MNCLHPGFIKPEFLVYRDICHAMFLLFGYKTNKREREKIQIPIKKAFGILFFLSKACFPPTRLVATNYLQYIIFKIIVKLPIILFRAKVYLATQPTNYKSKQQQNPYFSNMFVEQRHKYLLFCWWGYRVNERNIYKEMSKFTDHLKPSKHESKHGNMKLHYFTYPRTLV